MDPTLLLAAGALGLGSKGSTKTTQTSTQNVALANNTALNNTIAFNPVVAAITGPGAGVAPSVAGGASGGLTQTPTTTANPVTSVSDPGNALPRTSPTGYMIGPGSGYYGSAYPTSTGGLLGGLLNDDFLLLAMIGVGLYFAFAER